MFVFPKAPLLLPYFRYALKYSLKAKVQMNSAAVLLKIDCFMAFSSMTDNRRLTAFVFLLI